MPYYRAVKRPIHYRLIYLIKKHKIPCCISMCVFIFLMIYLFNSRNNLVYLSDNIAIPYERLQRNLIIN